MFTEKLCGDEIVSLLDTDVRDVITIDTVPCVESTNDSVKCVAKNGGKEGYLLIAEQQTGGKGRLGRSFFSPDKTGVYMSLLLRPDCSPADSTLITTAAAVAVCLALEKAGVADATIKWVNDVFVDGKKVCGILTEAGFNAGSNKMDYVVLGVGVNLYNPEGDFPEEIKGIAGAVFDEVKMGVRSLFIAEFLNAFFHFYKELQLREYVSLYRERCNVIGKKINVISGGTCVPAEALDVDENCNLVIKYDNGEIAVIGSGEISVRCIGQLNQ